METVEQEGARNIIDISLKHLQISKKDLKLRKPGSLEKQMIAALLRQYTTMTRKWIVEELHMGSESSVYNAVKRTEQLTGQEKRKWNQLQKVTESLHCPLFFGTALFWDEAVHRANLEQHLEIKLPCLEWKPCSDIVDWHSAVWIENVSGSFSRKSTGNSIGAGHIMIGTGDEPPGI